MRRSGERDGLKSTGLCGMLAKGMKKKDNSLAFAKKAGRISGNIHPI